MAAKTSLRQFQQELAVRLSNAKSEPAAATRLGMQCGSGHWLVDLVEAGEIVPVPALMPVPLTKAWYAGLANVRGSLLSVVDFSAFATGVATPRAPENRLLLVGAKLGINSALLVSRMLGLRNPRDFRPLAAQAAGAPWAGQMYSDAGGQSWRDLKLKALVTDVEFLRVGL